MKTGFIVVSILKGASTKEEDQFYSPYLQKIDVYKISILNVKPWTIHSNTFTLTPWTSVISICETIHILSSVISVAVGRALPFRVRETRMIYIRRSRRPFKEHVTFVFWMMSRFITPVPLVNNPSAWIVYKKYPQKYAPIVEAV
jgi:hypothetical protein